MITGIRFPSQEIGSDRAVLRDWALRAAGAGFSYIAVNDHVVGVDPVARPDYGAGFPDAARRTAASYSVHTEFHEPLTTIAHLAALCPDLGFSTGVLVCPQRQTALVAKQAAEADILTGGRLRLGVGVGWNPVEYEAMGADFRTRGRRIEEQVSILRALWTRRTVEIDGEFDRVVGVGLAPRPLQQPIPVWMGGWSDVVLDRIGRIADGWYHGGEFEPGVLRKTERIVAAAERAGRRASDIGLEGAVELRYGLDGIEGRARQWARAGATHLVVDPMHAGYRGSGHLDHLARIAERLPLGG
ncbi:TIGR03619 family F420-dependent LLM class oxidoreductase [Kitasatospora sp. NPDC086801]|uniref:TIGR03619 family F420-dependent LLM class oxidoreductase n=1 Tax=Kitasatospora sp. NPDC086801 TaxID=3364066 RepID=UPI0038010618